ncbi:TetR/AcrR family transcriptional regulator [Streptomyces muensis]|uniref:TetR/AcrR family transcriptional regulator n=1 Tax=Streptomyces muensis TaxID=1077944 RepID=A0A9X1TJE7_STRM4|nr:TetR/AcrR family transcriptional regulator [Streptomyces muensis]MCF1592524.1 TetR/AcrR family transcriptional regulator [Streptomyces muensis]
MTASEADHVERKRNRAGQARKAQLLELALTKFSKEGYQETSLQDLATSLGITRPLFYYYFGSKEELLQALIGHLGDAMLERNRPILNSGAPPMARLGAALRIHANLLFDNSDAFRVYFAERDRASTAVPSGGAGEDEYLALLTETVAAGQADQSIRQGPPRILALLAIGLLNSALRWYSPEGRLSKDELTEIAAEMALGSLRRPPSSS